MTVFFLTSAVDKCRYVLHPRDTGYEQRRTCSDSQAVALCKCCTPYIRVQTEVSRSVAETERGGSRWGSFGGDHSLSFVYCSADILHIRRHLRTYLSTALPARTRDLSFSLQTERDERKSYDISKRRRCFYFERAGLVASVDTP